MKIKHTWVYRLCQAWAWLLYKIWYYPHGPWGWEWFAIVWYTNFNKNRAGALAKELFPEGF